MVRLGGTNVSLGTLSNENVAVRNVPFGNRKACVLFVGTVLLLAMRKKTLVLMFISWPDVLITRQKRNIGLPVAIRDTWDVKTVRHCLRSLLLRLMALGL